MTATHECPCAKCDIDVPNAMLMCARHWRMVPEPLREAVYATVNKDIATHQRNAAEAVRVVDEIEAGFPALGLDPGTRAYTIYQPWASLIMIGAKKHEFRKWKFTDKPAFAKLVGQRVVIHASARPIKLGEVTDIIGRIDCEESELVADIARPFLDDVRKKLVMKHPIPECPRSAALGTAIMGEPKSVGDLFGETFPDSDRLNHHLYGWPMLEPVSFPKPIPSAGAQGFWFWS